MKKKFYSILALLSIGALPALSQSTVNTYNFTGGIQTLTVPCGVDSIFIQTWGAQGGAGAIGGGGSTGGNGGLGGYAEGWLLVNSGDVLNIMVGGQGGTPTGGFNGGANGGSTNAGGGGGASDVRLNGTAESDRVITAGGGGGGGRGACDEGSASVAGGGGNGSGGGSGLAGSDGFTAPTSGGAAGGGFGGNFGNVQGALGAKGIGCSGFSGSDGAAATTGTGGTGGAGQTCCCSTAPSIPGGGGGGGGQLGGGGGGGGSAGTTSCSGNSKGAGGGGGGGSSYVGGVVGGVTNAGIWLGNGMVTLTYNIATPSAANITGASLTMCEGGTLSFSTPSDPNATFYTWTVDPGLNFISGQNTTNIVVGGLTPGTFTIMAVAVNGTCSLTGTADTIVVTVLANPTVVMSAQASACVTDGAVTLAGAPAGGTFSGTAVTGASFSPSTAGAGSFVLTYTYTDSSGCVGVDTASIVVDPCLGITTVANNSVSVSPNPAADVLNLSWNANAGVTSIKIMDVTGRVVMTENAVNGTTKQLDIKKLPAGTYTVSLEGKEKIVQTFVKQ